MSAGGGDPGSSNGHWPLNLLDQPRHCTFSVARDCGVQATCVLTNSCVMMYIAF